MPFNPEPAFAHDAIARTGVLLVNLGTPEAPTPKAVRTYLKEFLSDPRVVEIPRAVWWPILNGIILNVRPRKSAKKYESIWTPDGSPLRVHTERQAKLLKGFLGLRFRSPMAVTFAMRYGEPSIASAIEELKAAHCDRILVVPLYPQYAASTTATALDKVFETLARTRNVPELRVVRSFPDDPGYIEALAEQVREYWRANGRPDRLVMSFHGLPLYTLQRGDPYHCECQVTARRLADALQLKPEEWILTFQSRFGKAEWLKPYTAQTLEELGHKGVKRIDVITPGFVADCLETLEEIAMEGREIFLEAGGESYHVLPCLNERPSWIKALAGIVATHLHGWASEQWDAGADEATRAERKARAKALGAAG